MKRLTIIICSLILLTMSSCEKNYVTPANRTIITTLSSGNWVKLNGGKTYTAAINMPEIDNYFNENGGVLVYISFGSQTYEAIPQVYDGISYSFTTRPGQIVIDIQSSDGISVITPPGSVTVKIVLIDSAK